MRKDEEIARFCAQHGVGGSDLLIVRTLIPFETRPGETAKEAYERELASIAERAARHDPSGKGNRSCRMHRESVRPGNYRHGFSGEAIAERRAVRPTLI